MVEGPGHVPLDQIQENMERERDDAVSEARARFDWEKQFELALDPEWAMELRQQALQERSAQNQHGSEYCTMCGPDFCSVRLSKKLKESGGHL